MKTVQMEVFTYNQLPASQRKTENGDRFARVNGEWRKVIFTHAKKVA